MTSLIPVSVPFALPTSPETVVGPVFEIPADARTAKDSEVPSGTAMAAAEALLDSVSTTSEDSANRQAPSVAADRVRFAPARCAFPDPDAACAGLPRGALPMFMFLFPREILVSADPRPDLRHFSLDRTLRGDLGRSRTDAVRP